MGWFDMIPAVLLDILVCPVCRASVHEKGDQVVCDDPACALAYPVQDGIPVMLVGEATSDIRKG